MPLTIGQLLAMHLAYQRDRYDHTTAIISAWSKKPVKNPYRKTKFVPMRPAELYAMQQALARRKANA